MSKDNYKVIHSEPIPIKPFAKFKQVVKRTFSLELLVGLKLIWKTMWGALFKGEMHTVKYPLEKMPVSPRYRAIHSLSRLLESGNERCIGCGLCEKICIANCIRMDTKIDENGRKQVTEYTINLGRCIFCGYCAEVCPELAIVHTDRYENASEQRAHFVLKDDMLTPIDLLKQGEQKEFKGYGSLHKDADTLVKKTPLAY
jgi:NADH-quinone oxidoreductase subunit I